VRAGTCSRHLTGHIWRGPRRSGTWLAWPAPAPGPGVPYGRAVRAARLEPSQPKRSSSRADAARDFGHLG